MKKVTLFLTLFLLAVVAACTPGGGGGGEGLITDPFIGGTTGLTFTFAEGAPPAEVFDAGTYPFDIELRLLNAGEADVDKGSVKVQISGINPTDFGKTESDFIKVGIDDDVLGQLIDSEGNIIESPPVFVSFSNLAYEDQLQGNNGYPVRADVCYTYQTQAIADGCIRSDVLSVDDNAVCQINEEKVVYNSGAPIHIEEFREQPSGSDKIRYIFKIKHLDNGRFYKPGSQCPADIQGSRENENKVKFNIESNLEDNLECTGLRDGTGTTGFVHLINGEATIHCSQQTSSNLDFIDKVQITLDYDYKDNIETDLVVKKTIN